MSNGQPAVIYLTRFYSQAFLKHGFIEGRLQNPCALYSTWLISNRWLQAHKSQLLKTMRILLGRLKYLHFVHRWTADVTDDEISDDYVTLYFCWRGINRFCGQKNHKAYCLQHIVGSENDLAMDRIKTWHGIKLAFEDFHSTWHVFWITPGVLR